MPVAEMIVPDAIDEHARGQRILRVGDPVRERHPPLLLGRIGGQRQVPAKLRESRRRDFLFLLHRVAAIQPIRRPRLLELARIDGGKRRQVANLFLQLATLRHQLRDFVHLIRRHVGSTSG